MAWTTPRTWVDGENTTAAIMNAHIRDNENALKDPASDNYEANEAADYTTANAAFEDVDSTNLTLAITLTEGTTGTVLVGFHGVFSHSAPNSINLDLFIDGATYAGGDDGILRIRPTAAGIAAAVCVEFLRLITGLTAGVEHTFALRWKTAAATATLYAGAGTANAADVHPQFWVREVS